MRILILGQAVQELPEMPAEIDQIWLTYPGDQALLDWSLSSGAAVTLVSKSPSKIPDEVLDQVADVQKASDPRSMLLEEAAPGDVFLLSWDDSDEMHSALSDLTDKGVTVQDLSDGFQQLVLQDPLEELMKAITESITRDVLRTVRAEMREQFQELSRGRRSRAAKE